MSDWKEYKDSPWGKIPLRWEISSIKEETEVVTDYVANGSFASLAENVKYRSEEDYAVLIRLVDYNNNFKGDFVYIDKNAYNFLGKSKLFGEEIIISNVGANVGTVFKCPRLKHHMSLAPNSIMVKFKGNNDFYYYWLRSHYGQHMLQSIVTGSAQPKFNKTNFKELAIPVPPLNEQIRIAEVFSSIDDKIDVNRRINENLEQQAQALFKSWFVDFEPFKDQPFVESELGMIPQGWRVENLSSIADYINGLAMQKFRPVDGERGLPVLKIKELGQGSVDNNSELCSPSLIGEKYIIDDGDIISSWSGTLMVKVWCGGKCGLNQHLFVVIPKDNPKWFVYQWTNYHLDNFIRIAKDKAVTMGHIKRGELDKAMVVVPDEDNLQRIDVLMSPIFNQMISLEQESRRLAELRDTLLPRLMSGEILL